MHVHFCSRVLHSVIFSELVPSSSASVEGVTICGKHFTHQNNARVKYGLSIVFYRSQSMHTQHSNVYKTWMACPSYFIVHSLCTRDAPTHTKLEWLVHCILLFTVCAHVTPQRIRDYRQVWGSLKLTPIRLMNLFNQLVTVWLQIFVRQYFCEFR